MNKKHITRRDFIKVTSATTAALALGGEVLAGVEKNKNPYDAKGLPTRQFGKTGVTIPMLAIGTGSRFCSMDNEDDALEMLTYALDHGFYYWDTANQYVYNGVSSEERLGKILKTRRKEVFVSTKIEDREPDDVKRAIEVSLKRLQTDHVDELKVHSVKDMDDLKVIAQKGGIYDILREMKEQGVTRFIGFSGHNSSEAMARAATDLEFDTMLIALNHWSKKGDRFEQDAVPAAAAKNMGVMVMKVVRPREKVKTVAVPDLINYALSLEKASGAVVGMDGMTVLKQNIELVRNFKPLSPQRMEELRMSLAPFNNSKELEWMQPGYRDGAWS